MRITYKIFAYLPLFLALACYKDTNYDVEISSLDDRLVILNDKISNINSDILNLDQRLAEISNQIKIMNDKSSQEAPTFTSEVYSVIDSSFTNLDNDTTKAVDPEKLFNETYSIKRLSKNSCGLRNIQDNKVQSFYNGDKIIIPYENSIQEYQIKEINRVKRFILIHNINFDIQFKFLYIIDSQ